MNRCHISDKHGLVDGHDSTCAAPLLSLITPTAAALAGEHTGEQHEAAKNEHDRREERDAQPEHGGIAFAIRERVSGAACDTVPAEMTQLTPYGHRKPVS